MNISVHLYQSNKTVLSKSIQIMSTVGKTITCKAAVIWEENAPFVVEEVQVQPPKAGEVRVKILACGVCHSDCYPIGDLTRKSRFPTIRGHEGGGIVESVGDGVTAFKTGDHVLTLFWPQCQECFVCKSAKGNSCFGLNETQGFGIMPEGTSRFTCRGQTVYHFLGASAFSEYTVVSQHSLTKINEKAPLEKVCLLACGVTTGYGSALNIGKVEPGSTCAVWGLGAVGLAVVMGCREAGASKIYGIDINPDKFELGKKFGLTDFVNPKDVPAGKTVSEYLMELTGIGFDYTFECVGKADLVRAAFESSSPVWGKTVIVGVDPGNSDIITPFLKFMGGRTLVGGLFGGCKPKRDIPNYVEKYMQGKLMVDEFITFNMKLEQINEAFESMLKGKSIHTVLIMDHKN